MRLWHKDLIPYLPDLQLKGQWRECALIADALAKNGTPNHLLVNRVTEYPIVDFWIYCEKIEKEMKRRGFHILSKTKDNIKKHLYDYMNNNGQLLMFYDRNKKVFDGWHNLEYLRICYANLLEKHNGIGKSRITDEEWRVLLDVYKAITGEEYKI